ncbi:DNA topoisomerase IV [Flavobacteriaceae bacterium 14752]|uniref:DNA topoisomerase IV n=1 Tax=Mesohalobacter salilacus TaxID=2491711 RepID=UPI000F63DC8B|nr:DNA topoisomerase IV [Flavobacteriaceae bacterium 14752]
MKYCLLILIIALTSCYSPNRDCSNFKTGKFKYEALVNGKLEKTIFIRNDSTQIEIYRTKTDTSKIRWINDCEFILTPVNPKSILDQYQMHMKILKTTPNSYTFEYNVVGETQKEIGRAEIIN